MVDATVGYATSKGLVRLLLLPITSGGYGPASDGGDTASNRDDVWTRQLPRLQCDLRVREPQLQRARRGGRTRDLRSLAKDAEAGRELTRPASNAASRASISLSHAVSTDSSSSSGRRATRSRRTNSCRSAGGRAIAFCNSTSTCLATASPLSIKLRFESINSSRDLGYQKMRSCNWFRKLYSLGEAKSTTVFSAAGSSDHSRGRPPL